MSGLGLVVDGPCRPELGSRYWWAGERRGARSRPSSSSRGSLRCARRCDRRSADAPSCWVSRSRLRCHSRPSPERPSCRSARTRSRRRRARRRARPTTGPWSSPTRSRTARRSSPPTRSAASTTAAPAPSDSRPRPTTAPPGRAVCCPASPSGPAAGPNDRATDASVAYDARHNAWLISSLTLREAGGVHGNAVVTSRSTNGGTTWSRPVHHRDGRRSRQELDRLRQHPDEPVLRQLLHAVGRPRGRQHAPDEHVERRRPDMVGRRRPTTAA